MGDKTPAENGYYEDQGEEAEQIPNHLMESPAPEQLVQMSDIRETTGEYMDDLDDERDRHAYAGHAYISDM